MVASGISEISTQIAAALTEVANRTQGTIVLSGHSAGGHLVARMTDPLLLGAEVRDRITRIVPISPVADLAPLLQTEMNDTLRLDEAEAAAAVGARNMWWPRASTIST